FYAYTISPIPKSPSYALSDPNWRNAMTNEYNALVKNGIFLSQRTYSTDILERAYILNCNLFKMPVDDEPKLGPSGIPVSDPTLYRCLAVLKCILRYVRGTLDYGLQMYASPSTSLITFTDGDWAGCPIKRLSIVGLLTLSLKLPRFAIFCHHRTKHIEIDLHFVCDQVTVGNVRVLHVPSHYLFADIFTKGLPCSLFTEYRSSLSVRLPPTLTTRAY
nr:hypothetical protein [Tanacetum cinerariifolium]